MHLTSDPLLNKFFPKVLIVIISYLSIHNSVYELLMSSDSTYIGHNPLYCVSRKSNKVDKMEKPVDIKKQSFIYQYIFSSLGGKVNSYISKIINSIIRINFKLLRS